MQDIVTKLFNQNQVVFLIQVFLSLDIESLKKCFQVCPSWRIFLEEYLLYSSFNHTKIIHKAWLQFKPAHEKVITHGSITHISSSRSCDDVIVSFTNGDADIISKEKVNTITEEQLDNEKNNYYTSSGAEIGENIIAKINFGVDETGKCISQVVVKLKDSLTTIYKTELDSFVTFTLTENTVFIRNGTLLKEIIFRMGCDNIQEINRKIFDEKVNSFKVVDHYLLYNSNKCLTIVDTETGSDETGGDITVRTDDNIIDLTVSWPNVVIISNFTLSVIKTCNESNNNGVRLKMKAKLSQQLISVKHNQVVVAVLARINTIYLFTWRGKIEIVSSCNSNCCFICRFINRQW